MPPNPNVMGYPFPPNTQAVSSFFLLSSLLAQNFLLVLVINPSFFKFQPIIQEHKDLVWLAENLKLEVTN